MEIETSTDSNEEYLNLYLNDSLKKELIYETHGRNLIGTHLFKGFDDHLLAKVAHFVQEIFYSPEDTVFLVSIGYYV